MSSILDDVKTMLDIEPTNIAFDVEVLAAINSAIFKLDQLGVGSVANITVTDSTATWAELIAEHSSNVAGVKTYIYLNSKLVFDPPTTGFLLEASKGQIEELGWRLSVQVENETLEV